MENPLSHLAHILDLLGPGLFLVVDKSAFPRFFDGDIGRESAVIEANAFAKQHGCQFFSDGHSVKFGRAYSKKLGE